MIGDKAYDSDKRADEWAEESIELIAHHRTNRKHMTQDGRPLPARSPFFFQISFPHLAGFGVYGDEGGSSCPQTFGKRRRSGLFRVEENQGNELNRVEKTYSRNQDENGGMAGAAVP